MPVAWQVGEQPAVAAAILELFHLLPAQSAKFMETEGAFGIHLDGLAAHLDLRVICAATCRVCACLHVVSPCIICLRGIAHILTKKNIRKLQGLHRLSRE